MRRCIERARQEAGFTLIELLVTAVILAVVSAPITGVLLAASADSARARDDTSANQLLASKLEAIRTLSYSQVGIVNGNPPGVLVASSTASLTNGLGVTVQIDVNYVNDPIPTAYVTNADYKQVTVTITRTSDGKQLAAGSTYVASASAPPLAGTDWVQIKRQVVDAVTTAPLPGATVTVTGGPGGSTRNDIGDGSGTVLFPALDSAASGTPVYAITSTLSGYSVFPDDIAPMAPGQLAPFPGVTSNAVIRMYKAATLTVNLQTSSGAAYTGGATVSIESSRCGVATVSVPSGQSSTTVTNCQWATGKTTPLVPNVLGQTPNFDKYGATAWNTTSGLWGAATLFTVPSNYPTTLTQSVTVKFGATTYPSTKQVTVKITKGGSADSNARVIVNGGPAGVYLYGTTDGSGNATFTIPVTSSSTTYTVNSNDQGAASGTGTFSASTASTSPINTTVAIS